MRPRWERRVGALLERDSCQLTLDPNTANSRLSLSGGNRKVTGGAEQPYPDHPERFDSWSQVLCRESLTGRCYWEAEWDGDAACIGVTYKGIERKGGSDSCAAKLPPGLEGSVPGTLGGSKIRDELTKNIW
ncbi:cytolytic toxin-alpha-like [Brienomyrus brachyistius]|uniref:cytolytic toxin-alpha-like n=1 Tax=Brienomyrus brachyistius TaxID=42636 RepID=UPI0020B2CD2B|nr:cytolytic toxin-alpha-like [Brienomyrus brachyistius]